MRAIITSDCPQISRLHLAGAGRQDLGGGLIDEQPRARQEISFHPTGQAPEPGSGSARPVAHGSPVDLNALTSQRLRLPIEGHVIGIFPHQNIGDQRLSGQAAWHHMLGCGRLEHAVAAGAARHSRPGRDDHAILDRDHIKPARYVAVYAVQRASAAGTFLLVWKDHFLNPGQVRGQRRPCCPAFPPRPFLLLACRLLAKRLQFSTGDVEIIEGKRQLIFAQLLRPFPECRAGDLVDDMLHPSFTLEAGQDHRLEGGDIVRKVGCRGGHAPFLAVLERSAMAFRSRESGVRPIASSPEPGCAACAFSTIAALRTRPTPAMPTAA